MAEFISEARARERKLAKLIPQHAISPAVRRHITDYAHEVWGSRKHAHNLLAYTAFYGEFLEGWVPWTYYNEVLVPSWGHSDLVGAKTMSQRFLPAGLMPDLAYCVRDCWSDVNNAPLRTSDVADFVFANHTSVFVKTDMGGRGHGVFRYTRDMFDLNDLAVLGDISIQAPIEQHPVLDSLSPGSVATLRVTTVKPNGAPACTPGSHLRVGRGGTDVVGNGRAIEIGVHNDTGTLSRLGQMDWTPVTKHVDSGVTFEGTVIPGFHRARALCERLHDTLPHMHLIGWDIAIDVDENPIVIEINTKAPQFCSHQILMGAHFTGFGWEDVWRS
jgi:hypothetical protein